MNVVSTPKAPKPAGHYSQAVIHHGVVYVAGQLGYNPADPQAGPGSIEEQTEQTLRNIEAILQAAGSGLQQVLQATVYVTDMALWGRVNDVYARVMGDHRPARAVVPVKELRRGFQVEIQAIAAVAG